MMNSGSSSKGQQAVDHSNRLNVNLERRFDELFDPGYEGFLANSGMDTTTVNPSRITSQPMSRTNVRGRSPLQGSMQPQYVNSQATMSVGNQSQVLTAQSSQSRRADFSQNQPLRQQVFKHAKNPIANQSNSAISGQYNHHLQYIMQSNQLVPDSRPILNTQTSGIQNNQASSLHILQNPNQTQLQSQQRLGNSSRLLSGGLRQPNIDLKGFLTPRDFGSSALWREYVLQQIREMKDAYDTGLQKMLQRAIRYSLQAKDVTTAQHYDDVKIFLEKMIFFLNLTTVESIPESDEKVYSYMNRIVNFVNYHKKKKQHNTGSSSNQREPVPQPPNEPRVQPNAATMRQYNQPSNSSSQPQLQPRSPQLQLQVQQQSKSQQRARTLSSLGNNAFEMGLDQNPMNSQQRIGSFKAPQAIVSSSTEQNSRSKTINVNESKLPLDWYSNTMLTNYIHQSLKHQLPVGNQDLNLEKLKQPIDNMNELTESRVGPTISPLGSRLLNHIPFSLQSTMKPTSDHQTESSKFDAKSLFSSQSIPSSPFILSGSSASNQSSLTSVDAQKVQTSVDPDCNEKSQDSTDAISRLVDVVKSMTSKSMASSLNAINLVQNSMDSIPFCAPERNIRRKLNVSSVLLDSLTSEERPQIKNKGIILGEITEINKRMLQTYLKVVSDVQPADGTMVRCTFKNVCFRDIQMPELFVNLHVPGNYPDISPKVLSSSDTELSEEWKKLYQEMLTRFDVSLDAVPGPLSLGEMAKNWEASVRSVMTEFMRKKGAQSFSDRYGNWESCISCESN